jgi:hypothetical protein
MSDSAILCPECNPYKSHIQELTEFMTIANYELGLEDFGKEFYKAMAKNILEHTRKIRGEHE